MQRIQLNTDSAVRVVPLLRSIAKEIAERSLTILHLETRARAFGETLVEDDSEQVAALANQRRELRRSQEELKSLGWERDGRGPFQFKTRGVRGEETYTWRPEDSFFFKTAQL